MKIEIGRERSERIELHGNDTGFGPPVILLHGWPVSSIVWEKQLPALIEAGHRVISYDRRGFGRSGRAAGGYDYDTLAEDLNRVIETLDLAQCALVGYGMGCGEMLRYLANFGADRIRSAAFVAPQPPFLRLGGTLPDPALDLAFDLAFDRTIDEIQRAMEVDHYACLASFLAQCFERDGGTTAGPAGALHEAVRRAYWNDAVTTPCPVALACVQAWRADLRDDLPRIDLPTLEIHGTGDRLAAPYARGRRAVLGLPGTRTCFIDAAPHALPWTHAAQVNDALLSFLSLP